MTQKLEKLDEPVSRLTIVFEGVGSAHFTMHVENITPLQLLALSAFLEVEAKQHLLAQKAQQQQQLAEQKKIIVPKLEVAK